MVLVEVFLPSEVVTMLPVEQIVGQLVMLHNNGVIMKGFIKTKVTITPHQELFNLLNQLLHPQGSTVEDWDRAQDARNATDMNTKLFQVTLTLWQLL